MKLVRFRNDRRESYGVMSDDQIVCLRSFAKNSKLGLPPSLEEFVGLGAGQIQKLDRLLKRASSETGLHGGTSQALIAGSVVTIDGDVIVAINGTRIMSVDDLLTYLEEYTLPGQTINVTIVRNNESMTLQVNLGKRPSPSTA